MKKYKMKFSVSFNLNVPNNFNLYKQCLNNCRREIKADIRDYIEFSAHNEESIIDIKPTSINIKVNCEAI